MEAPKFAKRRKRQLLAVIPILAVVVLRVVLLKKQPETPLFGLPTELVIGAAIAVILGFVAFTLWNWRCPACNRYLGKGISPSFCPKCGVPLQ
ncbi:MAG TPA: hypothetical protein VGX68_02145 [Thermoanaerobaculia bacterium]|nr:hypothetical protein [Thermoanaerobaculia bacterium]